MAKRCMDIRRLPRRLEATVSLDRVGAKKQPLLLSNGCLVFKILMLRVSRVASCSFLSTEQSATTRLLSTWIATRIWCRAATRCWCRRGTTCDRRCRRWAALRCGHRSRAARCGHRSWRRATCWCWSAAVCAATIKQLGIGVRTRCDSKKSKHQKR